MNALAVQLQPAAAPGYVIEQAEAIDIEQLRYGARVRSRLADGTEHVSETFDTLFQAQMYCAWIERHGVVLSLG